MKISPCSLAGLNSVNINEKNAIIDGINVQQNNRHNVPLKFFPT